MPDGQKLAWTCDLDPSCLVSMVQAATGSAMMWVGGVLYWPILGPLVPIEHYFNTEHLLDTSRIYHVSGDQNKAVLKGEGVQPFFLASWT